LIKQLLLIVVLICAFAGCQRDATDQAVTSRTLLITPAPPSTDPTIQQEDDRFFSRSFRSIGETIWYRGERPLFIRLYAKAGGTCHACSVEIGGYLAEYDAVRRQWQVMVSSFHIAETGSYGEAPEVHFLQLGPANYGFLMAPSYLAQGILVQRMQLFLASRSGFKEILDAPTCFDNSGFFADGSHSGSVRVAIHQLVNAEKELYDLQVNVIAKGAIPVDDDYGFKQLYGDAKELKFVFKGGVYLPEK